MDHHDLKSPIMATLVERGFVKDCTDLAGLDAAFAVGAVPAYAGFDLTAPSLHVGSMIPLMVLRHLRRAAVVASGMPPEGLGTRAEQVSPWGVDAVHMVLGDATTRVGDPSDKDGARPVLGADAIQANWPGIRDCIWSVVGGPAKEHFNSEWLDRLSFMDFLTGPARSMSLNRMVASDVVRRRLEAERPMTLMELIYQAMQAMDFAHLAAHHGVRLQIGGSDQWTNVLAGVDLARREHDIEVFGFTTPLLVDENGRKMGKTAEGTTVWLHPDRTSPFQLWQFWRNVPDEKVGEFLALFTELPMDEVRMWRSSEGAAINEAKRILATEAVAIVHGRSAAEQAERDARAVFSGGGAAEGMPSFECPHDPRATLVSVADLLVFTRLVPSKGAARRLAEQGGLRFNGLRIENADVHVEARDFADGALLLSAGKKNRVRITRDLDTPAPLLPRSTWIVDRPDGMFDVAGAWASSEDDMAVVDIVAGPYPDRSAAESRRKLVRLAPEASESIR